MKYRLLDLLACPEDKHWPLELKIKEKKMEEEEPTLPKPNDNTGVICQFYCAFKKFFLVDNPGTDGEITKTKEEIEKTVKIDDCKRCFKIEITSGELYCPKTEKHVFEIKEGIPIMLTEEQKKELYG